MMATIQWLAAKFRTQRNRNFKIAILFQSAFGSGTSKISAADKVFVKEGKGRQRQAACRNITRPQAMAEQVRDIIAVGCRRNACCELSAEL
jgi:hypothetical protein